MEARIHTGGPLKSAAIQERLLYSTKMPGSCAVSDASLVEYNRVKVHIISSAV